MSTHKQLIQGELHKLEQEEQIRILFACESGSRAWGFPSKDSDYDVRFVYIRPQSWYLSIFDKRDVIERPINNRLDISGWDLRKALSLFRKSNPALLEWLESPMKYMEQYTVAERMRSLSHVAFSPRSCMYHYLNMAKGNYRDYLMGDHVKIKKYFYVLRPILACCWIEQFGTMPPMEFDRLVDTLIPEGSDLKQVIRSLLARKKMGDELDYEPKIGEIHAFIGENIEHYDRTTASFTHSQVNIDEQLEALFLSSLEEVWKT